MHLKDMGRGKDEDEPVVDRPVSSEYPYGLAIRLTEKELKKLGLDDEVDVGDFLHGNFMAKVMSVTTHAHDGGKGCCVELQIVAMGIEDESAEYDDEDDGE